MDVSFLGIIYVVVFTMIIFILTILHNSIIPKKQNIFFLITALLIIIIIILEAITLIFDNSPIKYKWIHFTSNFLGFCLSPLLEYTIGIALVPDEKKSKWYFILWCGFTCWMIITSIFGNGVFYIDENNHYSRDKGFIVYIIISVIGILFLFFENLSLLKKMQHKGAKVVWINYGFMFFSLFFQAIWPQVHTTWLCAAFSSAMYYMYYNEILQQIDPLTGLFNNNNFLLEYSKIKKESILVVIEIENFAKLRHFYTRGESNKMIISIATEIKNYYSKYGRCFSLNTGEFCIIVPNKKYNFEIINKAFFMKYITSNYKKENLTLLTIGYTSVKPKENIDTVLTRTDVSKRKFLEERLYYLYS